MNKDYVYIYQSIIPYFSCVLSPLLTYKIDLVVSGTTGDMSQNCMLSIILIRRRLLQFTVGFFLNLR